MGMMMVMVTNMLVVMIEIRSCDDQYDDDGGIDADEYDNNDEDAPLDGIVSTKQLFIELVAATVFVYSNTILLYSSSYCQR